MKIALFASAFAPHIGGVEELVRQLAHAYRRAGDEAIVLTNRWPRDLPAYEEFEGIPTYRLAMRVPEGSLKARFNYRLTHRKIAREMLDILRRHEIGVLHVQCVSSNGYYALLARQQLKLPLFVTTQGERTMDAAGLYQHSPFMNKVLRDLLKEADFISACSGDTLRDIEEFSGNALGERAKVIYNGIQLRDFQNIAPHAHPRPYIFGIGRWVPQKGFDVLIRAFERADVQTHDLLLAGEGAERPNLEKLAQEVNARSGRKRVHLLGRADRAQTVQLFAGCDFFVLPSRMEPQGIVNLEAMASGKAVVASRVGGVPEIVLDGQTGLLVNGDDVEDLARALKSVAQNPTLRESLAVAGKARAQEFDWTQIAAQYRAVYQQIGVESHLQVLADDTDIAKAIIDDIGK